MGIYEEYIEKYPNLTNSEMADLILDQEDINIKRKSIMRSLQRLSEPNPEICGSGRKGDSYHLLEDEYEFEFPEGSFDIPKDQIAAACAWYVDPDGHTIKEVCTRLWSFYKRDITEDYMARIFRCLGVTKASNGLAPHIVAEWDEEDVSEFFLKMRADKLDRKLSDTSQFKTLYEEEKKKTIFLEGFIHGLENSIEKMPELDDVPYEYGSNHTDMALVLSDWHVGMTHSEYNKDIYVNRIAQLCNEIKAEMPSDICDLYVFILGDMLDGPLGNMRPEQGLHHDLTHEDQVVWTSKGIAAVINRASSLVSGEVHIHALGGNHGRVGPHRNDDPTRFADKMTYVLAQEMLSDRKFNWNIYSDVLGDIMCRNTQILFSHGDRGSTKAQNLVWANRRKEADSFVVLQGHRHSVVAEEVDKNIYFFRGGCLCGADDYAKSMGFNARPAQIMFEIRNSGPRMPVLLPVM